MNRLAYQTAHASALVRGLVWRKNQALTGTRVLMFHDLHENGDPNDLYSIPVNTFVSGIRRLANWATASRTPWVRFDSDPTPGVAITFDDGYRSTLRLAAEVLVEHGIPFHVFVTKHYVESNDARYLTCDDVRSLVSLPLATVGVHGATHSRFTDLAPDVLQRELQDSMHWLEDLIGSKVTSLSYPHGALNDAVVNEVSAAGFTAAACSACGTYRDTSLRLRIPRIDVWSRDTSATFVSKTRGDWDHVLP